MSVTTFPGRTPPAPEGQGTKEPFAVMGASTGGFFFGLLTHEIPPGMDHELAFRAFVEHAFDGVSGFRFGVVVGRDQLA